MRFYLYAGNDSVGWAEFSDGDPPMGTVFGVLYPTRAYARIRPVVLERWGPETIPWKRLPAAEEAVLWANVADLDLQIRTELDEALDPEGGIAILDFRDELTDEDIHIEVAGIAPDTYRRLFPQFWRQYFG